MARIATVKVIAGDDFIIINESDFDAKTMKKYIEPKASKKPAKGAE